AQQRCPARQRRRPARLPACDRARRGAAAAGRHPLLDAALLRGRGGTAAAGRGHRQRHRRGLGMRTIRCHVDAPLQPGLTVELPESAAAHVVRVLRLGVGDALVLFNGDGHDYPATLVEAGKRGARAEVGGQVPVTNESPLRITLAQGVARGEKMDWVLQKATELGVAAIAPILSERTEVKLDAERADKRLAHWRGVLASACEQCGRARLPDLAAPTPLANWAAAAPDGLKLALDPEGELT